MEKRHKGIDNQCMIDTAIDTVFISFDALQTLVGKDVDPYEWPLFNRLKKLRYLVSMRNDMAVMGKTKSGPQTSLLQTAKRLAHMFPELERFTLAVSILGPAGKDAGEFSLSGAGQYIDSSRVSSLLNLAYETLKVDDGMPPSWSPPTVDMRGLRLSHWY